MQHKNIWTKNNIFKDDFIVIGNWDFKNIKTFSKCDFIAADTETKLYYKKNLLSEEMAYDFYKAFGAEWCRKNIVVKAYAFTISNGESFALFQNIEDFLLCCSMLMIKKCFWYNAKFDFALFDYYFETNNWIPSDKLIKENEKYGKLPDKTYQSLNGDFGQRYQLRIWKSYINKTYHKKVHNFKMIDICNIFGGGLRKNLIDWNIIDKNGQKVRKLTMDYVNAKIEDDLEYMIADTKGLYLLAEKINESVEEISGFSLFKGDYITAGGLAKKSLLKFMFQKESVKENMKIFRMCFPMTIEEDKDFRHNKLYQGGKCIVSPYYVNRIVKNIYKYDVNSMYPTQMKTMLYPCYEGKKVDKFSNDKNKIYVLKVKNIYGYMKENMIPVWYDSLVGEYKSEFQEFESHYFWREELICLEKFYDMDYEIEEIIEYEGRIPKGVKAYVDNYYNIKKNEKGTKRNGAKLFLNSAYGKLAERIEVQKCDYKISEGGYIHLVKGDITIDEKKLMSVLVGSRITALSRVMLMDYILKICKNNPKKYFLYCDTDSVHALCEYDDVDDKELGKMKFEGKYDYGKYLAPKTYLLYDEKNNDYEIHTKGVNVDVVRKEIEQCKTFEQASEKFKSGVKYKCLTSLNCIGGKALIYIDKKLLNPIREKTPLNDDELMEI